MTMQRSVEGFRALGDEELMKRQAKVLEDARKRHPGLEDFPLTGRLPQESSSRTEAISIELSPETQRLIEHMRNDGYTVYDTAGKNPVSLRTEGMRYSYLNPALEERTTPPALVAFKIDPQESFLRGSQNIPHDKQLELLAEEALKVERQYPSAGLITREGKVSEWTELALRHLRETSNIGHGVRIFGRDYGYNYTWTDTYESDQPGAGRAVVGHWDETVGLCVALWAPGDVVPSLRLAPLVEIPRK